MLYTGIGASQRNDHVLRHHISTVILKAFDINHCLESIPFLFFIDISINDLMLSFVSIDTRYANIKNNAL